jgi:hypothetical protein
MMLAGKIKPEAGSDPTRLRKPRLRRSVLAACRQRSSEFLVSIFA